MRTKLKFVAMEKNVAFRCLEIRLGFRNEQAFCVHHKRLTGEVSGRKENQTRCESVLAGTPADRRCQTIEAEDKRERREKGGVHPSAAATVVRESTSCLVAFNVATGGGAPLRDCGRS